MPSKKAYQELVTKITHHDWDEESKITIISPEYEYEIEQFQGTAFISDYACYKVSGWEWVPQGVIYHHHKEGARFVAKQTNLLELLHLKRLNDEGFPVPAVIGNARFPNTTQKVVLFETMLPGEELYLVDTQSAWVAATDAIASIHKKYWNPSQEASEWWKSLDVSASEVADKHLNGIMNAVVSHSERRKLWEKATEQVLQRMKTAPRTLVHGDLFPTNILVNREQGGDRIGIIDWAYSGEMPYFWDLGRFTGLLKVNTAERLCRFEESVCRRYYDKLKNELAISYEDFMKDVYMGQFIEVMRYYDPSVEMFGPRSSQGHMATVNRLNELCNLILQ